MFANYSNCKVIFQNTPNPKSDPHLTKSDPPVRERKDLREEAEGRREEKEARGSAEANCLRARHRCARDSEASPIYMYICIHLILARSQVPTRLPPPTPIPLPTTHLYYISHPPSRIQHLFNNWIPVLNCTGCTPIVRTDHLLSRCGQGLSNPLREPTYRELTQSKVGFMGGA
jgi:hypothetical protein